MQSINLNLVPGSFQQVFNCSQGDIGRQLTAKLFDGSTAYEIPAGSTVKIKATKPSGFGFDESATFSGSTVTITTAETMTNEWGRFPAELVITKDGNVIGTANFLFNIEKNPHPDSTVDGDAEEVIPELTLLVERVEAAASSVLDMEVVATTLPAGSQASYSYDEDLNKATFGIPQGEAGAGAAGVVASAYSSSKTYKVGDYVLHNSNLYRCITAITTAEAFTAAHWTQIVLADDVSDLKTDLDNIRIIGEPINPAYVSGYITNSGTFGNGDTRTGFIQFTGQYVTIVPKNSKIRVAEYSTNAVGGFTRFIRKDRTGDVLSFEPISGYYYAMDVFPISGGAYTPSNIPVDAITYYTIDNTDTSLSISGKPADAKAVGDRFAEEAHKSTFNIRSQERADVLFDMQSGHGFYNPLGAGNAPTDDTTDYIYGSQSVKFNYAGKASFTVMDLSDVVMDVKIKVNSITSGASINMYLTNDNTLSSYKVASLYKSTPSNQFETGIWGDVTFSTANMKTTGTPDLTKAKYIQFGVANGTANYNIQSIGYRTKGKQKPCISFTFDDGWSEVMLGAKILGKYNIPATAYIFTGCELTTSQLLSLKNDYGWDIELHGDSVFTEMTSDALKTYIEAQQEFVRSNGLGDGNHMAYPGGQNNIDVVNIVRQYCKTARTINSDAVSLESVPCPMPYNLRAVSGIGASGTSVASVKNLIDMVVNANGWLILVFHRIGDTATSMFCSESDLEEIASYAVASGADIKTVDAMWERN